MKAGLLFGVGNSDSKDLVHDAIGAIRRGTEFPSEGVALSRALRCAVQTRRSPRAVARTISIFTQDTLRRTKFSGCWGACAGS